MLYYEFTHNSPYEKQWAFATTVQPKSHVVMWQCRECGRAAQYPAGAFDVTVEGGSVFPDVLGCGAYPFLILSEQAVTMVKAAHIACFAAHPVTVVAIHKSRATLDDAPLYFRIEPWGECIVDFAASGAQINSVCNRCGEIRTRPAMIRRFAILEGSWDGCDLFRDRRYYPRVTFCTQRVVDVAMASGLTNSCFRKMS